jgi:hypothetical protein
VREKLVIAVCLCTAVAISAGLKSPLRHPGGNCDEFQRQNCAGAKVTAVKTNTGATYWALISEQGYYNIEFVAVGDYNLGVEQPGFEMTKITGIHVDTCQFQNYLRIWLIVQK